MGTWDTAKQLGFGVFRRCRSLQQDRSAQPLPQAVGFELTSVKAYFEEEAIRNFAPMRLLFDVELKPEG
jgi:hypothetical protein